MIFLGQFSWLAYKEQDIWHSTNLGPDSISVTMWSPSPNKSQVLIYKMEIIQDMHSFNKYTWNTYNVPGTVYSCGAQQLKKQNPFPHGTHTSFVKFKYDNIIELLAYSTCPVNDGYCNCISSCLVLSNSPSGLEGTAVNTSLYSRKDGLWYFLAAFLSHTSS